MIRLDPLFGWTNREIDEGGLQERDTEGAISGDQKPWDSHSDAVLYARRTFLAIRVGLFPENLVFAHVT